MPSRGIKYMVKSISLDPDRLGTIASFLCAVHCAITGIAVSVLSVIGFTYLQSPLLEWGFLGFALVFGGWAVVRGYGIHKAFTPALIFVAGFLLLVVSHVVEPRRPDGGSTGYAELLSVLGGICLISFHYFNRQFMKTCNHS